MENPCEENLPGSPETPLPNAPQQGSSDLIRLLSLGEVIDILRLVFLNWSRTSSISSAAGDV